MRTTIENLIFPCELKNKLRMKAGMNNLVVDFIDGHIISIDKTNLSIIEPHKIIVKNKEKILVAYLYDDNDKIYLPTSNAIISFTKFVQIINFMNKFI